MRDITVYTTPICSFCNSAKRLLSQRGYDFKEVNLEGDPELRAKLSAANNGYRTVPMIFIGEEFIGGFSELSTLDKTGGLSAKVALD